MTQEQYQTAIRLHKRLEALGEVKKEIEETEKHRLWYVKRYDPEIYPRKLWIAVGVPYAVIKDIFEDVAPMDDSTDAQVDHTRRLKPDVKGGVLIRFENRKAMTVANITHEATHAAMEIFCYVGAYHDPKNQEPFAYLCGWVAKCINEVKNNKK